MKLFPKSPVLRATFILAVLASNVAALTFLATKTSVQRMGPYFNSSAQFDTATGGSPGGQVRVFKNGVDTLIVGDVVYLSANNTVRKSTTLASYNTIMGVVVGGTKTNMQGVVSVPVASDTAALANQQVIVLSEGRAYVRIDAAAGIAPGLMLQPSATVAGKAMAKASTIDSLHRAFGRLIDSGIVSTSVLAHINVK